MSRKKDPLIRFWERIIKTSECWVWKPPLMAVGYGTIFANGKQQLAHRYAYELLVGPIPDEHQVHHKCGNRACVNPNHLVAISEKEHKRLHAGHLLKRNRELFNRTHCSNGHPMMGWNVFSPPSAGGARTCRVCRNEKQRVRRAAIEQ